MFWIGLAAAFAVLIWLLWELKVAPAVDDFGNWIEDDEKSDSDTKAEETRLPRSA